MCYLTALIYPVVSAAAAAVVVAVAAVVVVVVAAVDVLRVICWTVDEGQDDVVVVVDVVNQNVVVVCQNAVECQDACRDEACCWNVHLFALFLLFYAEVVAVEQV